MTEKYSHNWKDPDNKSIWTTGGGPEGEVEIMQFNDMSPESVEPEVELLRKAGYDIRIEPSQSENDLLKRGYLTPEEMSDPADWED